MPKVPMYTLAWSPATETYELYQTRDRGVLGIVPDGPAWFAWLNQVPSFAFVGKSGHFTARKEAKQRGDRYWYAYLATGEQLTKKYLGKSADLSLARLEHIAEILHIQSAAQMPPPVTWASASTNGEMDVTKRPLLAQRDTSLHPLLATKLHVPRPRTHLVPRAHLFERLRQGLARSLTLVSAPLGLVKRQCLPNGSWRATRLSRGSPWKWRTMIPRAFSPI
jgi:LuxR family transcriptional regulator, maltose regulon positive regulatory protein